MRYKIIQMLRQIGANYNSYMAETTSVLISSEASGEKYALAKEWGIPVVNVRWLVEIYQGNMEALRTPLDPKYTRLDLAESSLSIDRQAYETMMQGWLYPIKVTREMWSRQLEIKDEMRAKEQERKRKAEEIDGGDSTNSAPEVKKVKLNLGEQLSDQELLESPLRDPSLPTPRVMISGLAGSPYETVVDALVQLGGELAEPVQASHLVVAYLQRTPKLLTAISRGLHVVTPAWVMQSARRHAWLYEANFALQDPLAERQMGLRLSDSLARARALCMAGRQLFEGLTFWLSPAVPYPSVLKQLIPACGGEFSEQRPPRSVGDQDRPSHIMLCAEEDMHLCYYLWGSKCARLSKLNE